ncbi:MAG TPA: ribosome biogenesis GTP-binding protein YihA/YsxC [Thermoanaerobaculia bacterium]
MKIDTAEFERSALEAGQFLRDGLPEIAFAGRSNVGKSTLLNRLLARKALARTSRTPGRTQAVNYFLVNRRLRFVDLPGYGYAKASQGARRRWARLMEAYLQRAGGNGRIDAPVLLVQLIDGKVGATELDVEAHHYFASVGIPTLKVATKIDKLPRGKRPRSLKEIRQRLELPGSVDLVPFSAVSGEGIQQLWSAITAFLDSCREEHQGKRVHHD